MLTHVHKVVEHIGVGTWKQGWKIEVELQKKKDSDPRVLLVQTIGDSPSVVCLGETERDKRENHLSAVVTKKNSFPLSAGQDMGMVRFGEPAHTNDPSGPLLQSVKVLRVCFPLISAWHFIPTHPTLAGWLDSLPPINRPSYD